MRGCFHGGFVHYSIRCVSKRKKTFSAVDVFDILREIHSDVLLLQIHVEITRITNLIISRKCLLK